MKLKHRLSFWITGLAVGVFTTFSGCGSKTQTPLAAHIGASGAQSVYDFTVETIDGEKVKLEKYKDKPLLIVNVASKCGYTPQYEDLEKLYKKYEAQGLVILGFPANNFMGQEPGTNAEIKTFCTKNYGVTFPMFGKISVKGKDIAPLYQFLTEAGKHDVKWNFNKFLVDKTGKVVTYFGSGVKPFDAELTTAIEKSL